MLYSEISGHIKIMPDLYECRVCMVHMSSLIKYWKEKNLGSRKTLQQWYSSKTYNFKLIVVNLFLKEIKEKLRRSAICFVSMTESWKSNAIFSSVRKC
jgi:hypothetical protein